MSKLDFFGFPLQPKEPSEILINTGNGNGSTFTGVRRFDNIAYSSGAAIYTLDYSERAAIGTVLLINEDGLYEISIGDLVGGTLDSGVAKNILASQTTSAFSAIPAYLKLVSLSGASSGNSTRSRWLERGDKLYYLSNGTSSNADVAYLHVTQVARL